MTATYTELLHQIHDDLRIQHPEWIEPDGKSPMCDFYETRLLDLLTSLGRSESEERGPLSLAPQH